MSDELRDCIGEWTEKLRHVKYVGEIYLSAERLRVLASQYARQKQNLNNPFDTTLLIIAVNCAYHFYDDEGFWKHLFSLLNLENTLAQQQSLGTTIERSLKSLGFVETHRTGPFRYVGAVLEQSGVSHRYIPAFAEFVRGLENAFGWEGVLRLGIEEFRQRVGLIAGSSYLKEFLWDKAGREFTLHVCHLLRLYTEGIMSFAELREIPGLQPDFWNDFFACFAPRTTGQRTPHSHFAPPRLVFIPEEHCLALYFPSAELAGTVKFPPGKWEAPFSRLIEASRWAAEFTGEVHTKQGLLRWTARGWTPDGAFAVFDERGSLINRGETLVPGRYYLLAPDGCDVPGQILEDCGQVATPGIRYRGFRTMLRDNASVPGYTISSESESVRLFWENPESSRPPFAGFNPVEVFMGSLPRVEVSNWGSVEKNLVALFGDLGDGPERIRNKEDLARFRDKVGQKAPSEGRLWVTTLLRHGLLRNGPILSQLEFRLLPPLQFEAQDRVCGFWEEVAVPASLKPGIMFTLEGGKETGGFWKIAPGEAKLSGQIWTKYFSVNICFRLCRVGLLLSDSTPAQYLCTYDLEENRDFLMAGKPDVVAHLFFTDEEACVKVCVDGTGFGRGKSIRVSELFMQTGLPVCEMKAGIEGQTIGTGAFFVNPELFEASLLGGEPHVVPGSNTLTSVAQLCSKLFQAPLREIRINKIPTLCPHMNRWFHTLLVCAGLFDSCEVVVDGKLIKPSDPGDEGLLDDSLGEFLLLRERMIAGDEYDALRHRLVQQRSFIPPVPRWQKAFQGFLDGYEGTPTALPLERASKLKSLQDDFHTFLDGQEGGVSLQRAWDLYLKGNRLNALPILNQLEKGSLLVQELRDALKILILLRFARFRAARELLEHVHPLTEASVLHRRLGKALKLIFEEPCEKAGDSECSFAGAVFPLREEDAILLRVLSGDLKEVAIPNPDDAWNDWLFALTFCGVLATESSILARVNALLASGAPPSPDSDLILQRVSLLTRGTRNEQGF